MNNPSVFSSGGGGQQQYQQQQQQQPINSNLGSQNNYNTPSQSIDQQGKLSFHLLSLSVCSMRKNCQYFEMEKLNSKNRKNEEIKVW